MEITRLSTEYKKMFKRGIMRDVGSIIFMWFYQEDGMAKDHSTDTLHKRVLDWAHEQVRLGSDRELNQPKTKGSEWFWSKLGFLGAVTMGSLSALWESIIGIVRTLESKLVGIGIEEAEDAWERAGDALQSVFDGLTGIVDSKTILTRQEIKNIAAISVYGKQLSELNDVSPDVRKTLTEQLKKARLYVQTGGDSAGDEVSHLFKVFDTVKESPVNAAEKLKNMKWTKQNR